MPPTIILHQRNGKLKLCLVCLENEREILLNAKVKILASLRIIWANDI